MDKIGCDLYDFRKICELDQLGIECMENIKEVI